MSFKLPKPRKAQAKSRIEYSFEERLLLERIQQIRDEFEFKKRALLKKREDNNERVQRKGTQGRRW